MNFNYDLATWLYFFVGSFACTFGMFLVGKIALSRKFKDIKFYNYFIIALLSICMIFNSLIFDNIVQIFGILAILFTIYKIVLKENIVNSFLYSIITYAFFLAGEVILYLLLAFIETLFKVSILELLVKSATVNAVVSTMSCCFMSIVKVHINKFVNKINKDSILYIAILGVIALFVMLSSMYNLYLNNWKVDYKFILNIVIFFGCVVIFCILLKQYMDNKEITSKYLLQKDYLKTSAELIEKYSSTVHKYKNNLIAIKGYLKTDTKEAEDYIDNLLGDYSNKKYNWFTKINYIQIDAIRYLIYYKLSKAENENLKITVDVSSDVKNVPNDKIVVKESNILLEILGEYFDNAIYASKESNEKELSYVMYKENEKLVFVIANTYKGEVDLSSITKNGYTTKGKGHGLGLYDIEKTAKKNNWINLKYELVDSYFVATLSINIKEDNEN